MTRVYKKNPLGWFLLASCLVVSAHSKTYSYLAVKYLYQAKEAFEKKDFGGAKIAADKALEIEPEFGEAYLIKAAVAAQENNYELAKTFEEKAMKASPKLPDRISQKLEKEAHKVEETLTSQPFSHFNIKYHGAGQRETAWQTVSVLNEVYNEIGSRFGEFPSKPITVAIFTDQEFYDAWLAPMWLGGFFDPRDGKIRVRVEELPGGQEEFRKRTRHEFTHAFMYQFYSKEIPRWFSEGAAEFYAYFNPSDSFWKDTRLSELKRMLKGTPWLTVDEMQTTIKNKQGRVYLAYKLSEALCLYTAKERGDSWIPGVLTRMRNGMTFDTAYQDMTGITSEQMHAHLKRYLE